MSASLVGSEMCIRDSAKYLAPLEHSRASRTRARKVHPGAARPRNKRPCACLLYTSDAADDM
eukprot:7553750-Alexandrium_andersonii.AAC.1